MLAPAPMCHTFGTSESVAKKKRRSKRTGTWRLPKPPMSNWKKRSASVSSAAGSTRPVTASASG